RLDVERREFAEAIRSFSARECGTKAQLDALTENETRAHSPEILTKLSDLGWLGVSLPEEYGGGGAGFVDECVFIEEAHRGLLPGLLAYTTGLTAAQTYLKWGNEEQKKLICSNLAGGL